jgi:hypothetical protein
MSGSRTHDLGEEFCNILELFCLLFPASVITPTNQKSSLLKVETNVGTNVEKMERNPCVRKQTAVL